MNFVADESVDYPIIARLREVGHNVIAIVDIEPSISDEAVLEIANRESFVFLTGDKDFGEMVFREFRNNPGIILIRLPGLASKTKAGIVVSAIKEHADYLAKAFTVISAHSIRIRPQQFITLNDYLN